MKRKLQFGAVVCQMFLIILLSTSCQKEVTNDLVSSDTTSTTTNSLKIKTYAETIVSSTPGLSLSDSFSVSYDASDRLLSLVSLKNSGNKFVYTYNANKSYAVDIFIANALSIHETFFLNSLSLVDSTVQVNDTGDTSTEKYTYNSSKQLVSLKEYFFYNGTPDINITTYTYDGSGNVTKETSNNPASTTTYDYYLNLPNNISLGQEFLYRNKNLTKTTTYSSGGITSTATHTYTFDSQNRQTSEKVVADNGDIAIKRYTYY